MKKYKNILLLSVLIAVLLIVSQPRMVSYAWLYVDAQLREYVAVGDTASPWLNCYQLQFPVGSVSVSNEIATINWPGSAGHVVNATDDYAMTTDDLGKNIRMNNAANKTITLPSMGAAEDGALAWFEKVGNGRLTLDASDTDYVDNSGAGDGIYCQVGANYGTLGLKYCHADTRWYIIPGKGPWVTYD